MTENYLVFMADQGLLKNCPRQFENNGKIKVSRLMSEIMIIKLSPIKDFYSRFPGRDFCQALENVVTSYS